jgi:hypothetical protein
MDAPPLKELQDIRGRIQKATLAEDARSTALWCLGRLPGLYQQFRETNNTRYGDEIQRLVNGLRGALAEDPTAREAVTDRLVAMHERLGIPALRLAKPPR